MACGKDKMHKKTWMMGAIGLWLAGCVPSLQPLYTDKDLVFDRALLGTWSQTNREDRWVFTAEGTNAYKLVHTDKQGTAEFTAHLVQVQGQRYLDLFPKDVGAKLNELAICTLIPGHLFLWVKEAGNELQLGLISGQKLDKLLNAQPKLLLHDRLNDGLILTAPTADLQQLFARLGPSALFEEPKRLVPLAEPAGAEARERATETLSPASMTNGVFINAAGTYAVLDGRVTVDIVRATDGDFSFSFNDGNGRSSCEAWRLRRSGSWFILPCAPRSIWSYDGDKTVFLAEFDFEHKATRYSDTAATPAIMEKAPQEFLKRLPRLLQTKGQAP